MLLFMNRIILISIFSFVLLSSCVTYNFFIDESGEHKKVNYDDITVEIGVVSTSEKKQANYYYLGLEVHYDTDMDKKSDSIFIDEVCIVALGKNYQKCPIKLLYRSDENEYSAWDVFLPENTDSIMVGFNINTYNLESKKLVKKERLSEKLYSSKKKGFDSRI